ncbi:MAG TPA: energy transducer TonB [Stellaceae bacterium]|nr:energy transducer TonB [Stellaceae bacterium]
MPSAAFRDNPWRRLAWAMPSAGVLTAVALAGFLRLLAGEPPRGLAPSPLQVRLVDLPASPAATAVPSPPEAEPVFEPAPAEVPTPPAPPSSAPAPAVDPPPEPGTEAEPRATAPAPPPKPPARPSRPRASATTAAPPSTAALPPAPRPPATAAPRGNTTGASAIVKPMPEIPESLRRHELDLVAVARFRVAADGSAQVELIEATPNPQLNRLLLEALGRWKFFPAIENGKPVASTIDIRIPISIR